MSGASSPGCRRSDEVALIARCHRGEQRAWAELWTDYRASVRFAIIRGFQRHRVPAGEDLVEELVAELFFRLVRDNFRRLRRFDGRCGLSHWLRVVAGNLVVDWLRKRRADLSLDDPLHLPLRDRLTDPGLDPESHLARRRAAQRMVVLLDDLGPSDRRFMELFYGRGLPFERVADEMGTTVAAIYSRKSRVGRKLCEMQRLAGARRSALGARPSALGATPSSDQTAGFRSESR